VVPHLKNGDVDRLSEVFNEVLLDIAASTRGRLPRPDSASPVRAQPLA
jgi:hypothetical protein